MLVSRRAGLYLAVLGVLCLVSLALGRTGVLFNLETRRPGVRLPFPEICAVLAAAAGVSLLRPRTWQWDQVATRRAAAVAAGCAVLGSLLPVVVVAVGAVRLPDDFALAWRLSNASVLASATFLLAPFVGSAAAGALLLLLYFLHGLANNLWVDLAWLPITRFPDDQTHWAAAAALLAAASFVHYRTRGSTAWVQRSFARDD